MKELASYILNIEILNLYYPWLVGGILMVFWLIGFRYAYKISKAIDYKKGMGVFWNRTQFIVLGFIPEDIVIEDLKTLEEYEKFKRSIKLMYIFMIIIFIPYFFMMIFA